jgi:hypothetical protein
VVLAEAADHGGEGPAPGGRRVPLRELMDDRLLDVLLERSRDEAGGLRLTGEGSVLGELVKAVLERALEAELTAHLGYEKSDPAGHHSGNSRNGAIAKKVQTGVGPVALQVPRDRAATFEPVLVPKRSGRISGGLDDMIISLYAHGMSVRDIVHHLEQVYGTELSAESVSRITDAVLEEVRAWQDRSARCGSGRRRRPPRRRDGSGSCAPPGRRPRTRPAGRPGRTGAAGRSRAATARPAGPTRIRRTARTRW